VSTGEVADPRTESKALIALSGELDMGAVDAAEARLRDAIERRPRRLVVDLSAVTFVDSTGIRLLLRANELCRAGGVELSLSRPPDGVWRMLERFRLDTRLPFAATAAVPAGPAAPAREVPSTVAAGNLHLELAADTRAPGIARQAAAEATAGLPEPIREAALLLLSEVVTNAVRHGCSGPGDLVRLSLTRRAGSIRFEVEDPGPGIPAAIAEHQDGPLRESGWGLVMVDRLASRWGTERDPSRVWFELDG